MSAQNNLPCVVRVEGGKSEPVIKTTQRVRVGVFRSCLHWKTEPRSRLLARNHWGNGESAVTAKVGQSFRKRSSHNSWLERFRFSGGVPAGAGVPGHPDSASGKEFATNRAADHSLKQRPCQKENGPLRFAPFPYYEQRTIEASRVTSSPLVTNGRGWRRTRGQSCHVACRGICPGGF
jgi:hypothetical protein